MKEDRLKKLWQENPAPDVTYTLEEINAYRAQKSSDTQRDIRRNITFDIIYKSAIAAGLATLLFLVKAPPHLPWIIALLLLVDVGLIVFDRQFLKKADMLDESEPILASLRRKRTFLQESYRPFIFLGALSNPLLILTGFFFYFYFKYGEIRMAAPWEDPVLYIILLIGYLLALWAALPFYQQRRRELEECLEDMDDTQVATQKIAAHRRRRRQYMIMFAILAVVGLGLFFILLWQNK